MARKKYFEQSDFPYHVTNRCINKQWFCLPMEVVWELFENHLYMLHYGFNFRIHNFVLMNNHYHMILDTPDCNLSAGMKWFGQSLTLSINKEANRINQLWGGRFFRSIISSPNYYLHAYKYVYLNPVQAQMANDVLAYKFSTLRSVIGLEKSIIPIQENTILDMGIDSCLNWLNSRPTDKNWGAVNKALKKTEFKLAQRNNREHYLEKNLL